MTLQEAVEQGIERLRQPQWANDTDYIKIDILMPEKKLGPWLHLYSPINEIIGEKNPQSYLWFQFGNSEESNTWEAYTGPIDEAEKNDQP